MIPIEKMMIETDSPLLAPVPHREESNEPAFARHVIEKLAEILEIDPKQIEKQTDQNAIKLFGINL